MTPREEAIADCKYAKSLGETALQHHLRMWYAWDGGTQSDVDYYLTIDEIRVKLGTPRCLLEEHK